MQRFKPGDRVVFDKPSRHRLKEQFRGDHLIIEDYFFLENGFDVELKYSVKSTKEYQGDEPEMFFFLDSELSSLEPPEVFTDDEYKEFSYD